jgi:hypothetical protein
MIDGCDASIIDVASLRETRRDKRVEAEARRCAPRARHMQSQTDEPETQTAGPALRAQT